MSLGNVLINRLAQKSEEQIHYAFVRVSSTVPLSLPNFTLVMGAVLAKLCISFFLVSVKSICSSSGYLRYRFSLMVHKISF